MMMMTVIRDVAAFRPAIRHLEREEQVQKMENKEKGVRRENDGGRERLAGNNKEDLYSCYQDVYDYVGLKSRSGRQNKSKRKCAQ